MMVDPDRRDATLDTLHDDLTVGFADLKGEMQSGFAGLKGEMRAGFADLKSEMGAGFADLKSEMRTGFADLKAEMRSGFTDLKGETQSGFADLKTTLVAGFRSLPSRESSEEMVRLLREANRLHEERFTHLDVRIREQHLEVQQALRAVADGQRSLSADLKALVARIDALIRWRGDGGGEPSPA